jgi:anti-anti-sigma factor
MHFQTREENGVLRCEGYLDIRSVEELRSLLSECFGRNPQLMLDLSAVEGCDTAGVQLLYSACKQASQCGQELELHAVSAAIQNTALMLGIPLEALGAGVSGV